MGSSVAPSVPFDNGAQRSQGRRGRGKRLVTIFRRSLFTLVSVVLLVTILSALYDLGTEQVVAAPPLGPNEHIIQTGDVVTRYAQWGTRGPVLVLVPGFIESTFVWQRVGARLGKRFRVFALDVRGFGYTTHRAPYTLAADTAQLRDFLSDLHLGGPGEPRPVLVGHSSGAAIVANLARLKPRAASGVVLVDGDATSAGGGPGWAHMLIVDPYFTTIVRLLERHPFLLGGVWRSLCGNGCPPLQGKELDSWRRPLEVKGAEAALKTIVQAPLIGVSQAALSSLAVPAGIIRGQHDPQLPRARARQVAQWLHGAPVVTIPGAHHLPMISHPVRFVRELESMSRAMVHVRRD